MAKRNAAGAKGRKRGGTKRTPARAKARTTTSAARKRGATTSAAARKRATGRKAKASGRKATGRIAKSRNATARKATARKATARKVAARKVAARKATARKATAQKATARKATARKAPRRAGAARKIASAAAPKARSPRTVVPRTPPALNRERRTMGDEDLVPTPPSSLDLDRTASAARTGRRGLSNRIHEHTETSPALTGGDVDADWESAYSVGDEAPGGDNPTPDQDIVDDIGKAIGVQYEDNEELKGEKKISDRDRKRWELDPASAEDYEDR